MDFSDHSERSRYPSYRGHSVSSNPAIFASEPQESSRARRPVSQSLVLPFEHRPVIEPDADIYESIYDSRWRLLQQEANRRQRDNRISKSPTPVSSREGSLGPTAASASLALVNEKSAQVIRISRRGKDFGFTLRHFIVYPPEDNVGSLAVNNGTEEAFRMKQPMESIFVKNIKEGGPAQASGLRTGDRILSVNGVPVAHKSYSDVVHLIQATQGYLELVVVPKQDDYLQIYFSEIAQNPETNQRKPSNEGQAWLSSANGQTPAEPTYEPIPAPISKWRQEHKPPVLKMPPGNFIRPNPNGEVGMFTDRLSIESLSENVYAVPARVVAMSDSSTSLDSGSTAFTLHSGLSGQEEDQSSVSSQYRQPQGYCNSSAPHTKPNPNLVFQRPLPPIPVSFQESHQPRSIPAGFERRSLRLPSSFNRSASTALIRSSPMTASNEFWRENVRKISMPEPFGSKSRPHEFSRQWRPTISESIPEASNSPIKNGTTQMIRSSPQEAVQMKNIATKFSDRQASLQQTEMGTLPARQPLETEQSSVLIPLRKGDPESVEKVTAATVERTPETSKPVEVYSTVEDTKSTVPRRTKRTVVGRDELNLRRISYLMATKDDLVHDIDSAQDHLSKENVEAKSCVDGSKPSSHRVNKILSVFSKKSESPTSPTSGMKRLKDLNAAASKLTSLSEAIREEWIEILINELQGKKIDEPEWKTVYAVLTSQAMTFYNDKPEEKKELHADENALCIKTHQLTEVAARHKNQFRIRAEPSSEILVRAESCTSSQLWIQDLSEQHVSSEVKKSRMRKVGTRTRSPASQSPASKTRKQESSNEEVTDKDAKKTWKVKVSKQWKKKGSVPVVTYPEGGSIGVPLEKCPRSSKSGLEHVPLVVTICCSIVEEKGLDIIGIYRVPGNSAAVNYLTEQVNQGEENINLEDSKWGDVNVVSSLLKSFFRKLPDPIFTLELYATFISVSKIDDSLSRLKALKQLVHRLPEVNLATLKFVCFHLCKVIEHSEVNKMELRNLAIVFGPTLVRTSDDNMLSMVTDMGQQCRIIESILSNCDWFFNKDDLPADELGLEIIKLTADTEITQTGSQSVLLTNLHKLETSGKVSSPSRELSAKDIVSGIISAANQKISRSAKNKKDSVDASTKMSSSSPSNNHRYSDALFNGAVNMVDTASQVVKVDQSLMTKSIQTSGSTPLLENLTASVPVMENLVTSSPPSASAHHRSFPKTESAPDLIDSKDPGIWMKPADVENLSKVSLSSNEAQLFNGQVNEFRASPPKEEKMDLSRDVPRRDTLRLDNLEMANETSFANEINSTHQRFVSLNYLPNNTVYQPVFSTSHRGGSHGSMKSASKNDRNEDKILSLTTTFDEKLRLLLDPNYQTRSPPITSRCSDSDLKSWTSRDTERKIDSKSRVPLKTRDGFSRQRNNSLTKKEKQELNTLRKKVATFNPLTSKQLKMIENRRIKRRHTVGGTKDIPSFEKENFLSNESKSRIIDEVFTHRKLRFRASSPDLLLTPDLRRLSLPEPV